MSDTTTTIADLKQLVQAFVDERDWRQFHSPKNLSMSIAIEAAELMEHFQWIASPEREDQIATHDRDAIAEELSDVICYAISFANVMNIDIADSLRDKMKKNAIKYPAEDFRGRFR
ncbi:MAG: nucleotide pyrophosphohydrolase [Phycisphaerales bacterium]|nr:nucleotide pyrophosphohydrolase [Phycisphaerales bacterium]